MFRSLHFVVKRFLMFATAAPGDTIQPDCLSPIAPRKHEVSPVLALVRCERVVRVYYYCVGYCTRFQLEHWFGFRRE